MDPFACNQLRLMLVGFGHQITHVQRALLERMTGGASAHWRMLARRLATLHGPSG